MKLDQVTVLALDCQTTGATPAKGHLLELGWVRFRAGEEVDSVAGRIQSVLCSLPEDYAIPKSVARVTGITSEDLLSSIDPALVWALLEADIDAVQRANRNADVPCVIHFARFEKPFIQKLWEDYGTGDGLALELYCTHEMARLLVSELPRKGLRAVAGYLGAGIPELRRSSHHVLATVVVWKRFTEMLRERVGVETIEELGEWLKNSAIPERSREFPMPPEARSGLPDAPGVYRMHRSDGSLLYVGKAKSLRRRVQSYFRKNAKHAEHTLEMLSQAQGLGLSRTGSALEAAVLEVDLIKAFDPPYNRALRAGGRELVYAAPDFSAFFLEAMEPHCLGPLPDRSLFDAYCLAWRILGGEGGEDEVRQLGGLLNPSLDDELTRPVWEAGFELFRVENGRLLDLPEPRRVRAVGARLWRARQRELAARLEAAGMDDFESQPDEEVVEEAEEVKVWTPERVAKAFGWVVLRAAHLVRRAGWFELLANSTLVWGSETSHGESCHSVRVVNSVIDVRLVDESGSALDQPAKETLVSDRAQASFNLSGYDRLRVLTTEVRRILAEGRVVEIRFKSGRPLKGSRLEKILGCV